VSSAPALAISGSACTGPPAFSAALRRDGELLLELPAAAGRPDLAVLVQRLCARAGIAPRAVRTIVVDVGPGSYVGLRVAVTFARVLHRFGGAALQAVTSLEAMAAAWAEAARPRLPLRVRPLLDARRERWHSAVLEVAHSGIRTVRAAAALPPAASVSGLAAGEVILAALPLHAALHALAPRPDAVLHEPAPVSAAVLLSSRLQPRSVTAADLEPLYLMGSYAE